MTSLTHFKESPMEPTKKHQTSAIPLKVSREKENNNKKEARKFKQSFIQMMKQEFPDSKITDKSLSFFLFKLAGYEFDPDTFRITQRPSKFGGVWKEGPVQLVSESVNQYKSSLLINKRLIKLIHQPLCPCGAIWSCKSAEGTQAQKTTNGIFHLFCPSCGFYKFWSTQGEDNFLDDLLWVVVGSQVHHLPNLGTFFDCLTLVTMKNSTTLESSFKKK